MPRYFKWNENVFYIIASVHWSIQARLKKEFVKKGYGVTPDQWLILAHLNESGPMYQQRIATQQNKDKSSIKRLADHLENKALIYRKRSKHDLRKKKLYLTDKGRETVSGLNKIAEKSFEVACRDLNEVEFSALKRLLSRIGGVK